MLGLPRSSNKSDSVKKAAMKELRANVVLFTTLVVTVRLVPYLLHFAQES